MKIIFVSFVIGLLLIGCTPASVPTVSFRQTTTETAPLPTSTLIVNSKPIPSPTAIQLPFNSQLSDDDYCKPPYAFLPLSQGKDLSEEEIVSALMRIWLERYASPETPLFCRIGGFTIDRVYDDPGLYSEALEPKGDFVRIVLFSVKLIQLPTDWMSFAGELDHENWLHIGHVVAISEISEGYKLEFANP